MDAKLAPSKSSKGLFHQLASSPRKLRSRPLPAASTPATPQNILKNMFSNPSKSKTPRGNAAKRSVVAPKDNVLKTKSDNRFSPITKSSHSPVRSALEKTPLGHRKAYPFAENLANGSPGSAKLTNRSVPRKALSFLGTTPPKHPAKPSDIRLMNQIQTAAAMDTAGELEEALTNPGVNSSVSLRLRSASQL